MKRQILCARNDVFGLIVDDVVNLSSKQSVSNSIISCFYHKPTLRIVLQGFHRKFILVQKPVIDKSQILNF